MKSTNPNTSVSDKILLAIYELDKKREGGKKITKEDMVIKAWKMFPEEFCIKGYPQYPNADISKYVTKLFKNNMLKGSFYNYVITDKGKEYAEGIASDNIIEKGKQTYSSSRQIDTEIRRIRGSKVFQLFLKGETEFVESDFFDFIGTSSRSLNDSNKTAFTSKYNLIFKEVLPFCEKNKEKDQEAEKIIQLTKKLIQKFGDLIHRIEAVL